MDSIKSGGMGGKDRMEDSQEILERRAFLTVIKQDLLIKIAEAWANKAAQPILRDNFKIRMRGEKPVISSAKVMQFGMVSRFFEAEVEEMLTRVDKRYPGKRVNLEFWLYPYENGGRKLREDVLILPITTLTTKSSPEKKTAEKTVVANPITSTIQAATVEQAEALIAKTEQLDAQDEVTPIEPVEEETTNNAEIVPAEENVERGFLDKPISFDYYSWKAFPKSTIMKKIRKVLTFNGVETPRHLLRLLANNNPSEKEWLAFVAQLNNAVNSFDKMGEGSATDLRNWMRRSGLITKVFRTR